MFGMERGVNGDQGDVFIATPVAGQEVFVQQLVVIFQPLAGRRVDCNGIAGNRVVIRHHARAGGGVMGDIHQKRDAGCFAASGCDAEGGALLQPRWATNRQRCHHHLRIAIGPKDQVAIGIGQQHRHAAYVSVGQNNAKEFQRAGFDIGPGGNGAIRHAIGFPVEQAAG